MKLKDKIALITGSARGIGKSIALLFAKEGANPVIVDVDLEEANKFSQELNSQGGDTIALRADVSSLSSVQEMVAKVMQKYGRIDILINNAGITRDSLLIRMKEEDWDRVLSINLKGTFNCTQEVSKVMIKQRGGKIVNIASIIGIKIRQVLGLGESIYSFISFRLQILSEFLTTTNSFCPKKDTRLNLFIKELMPFSLISPASTIS